MKLSKIATSNYTYKLLIFITSLTLILSLFLTNVNPVLAHTAPAHGYHYDPATIDPIEYMYFFVGTEYQTALDAAASAWNATSAPGYFQRTNLSLDPEIHVSDSDYDEDWCACCIFVTSGNGIYDGNEVEIRFDTENMAGLTADQKKIVAEHELGHAYGLDELTADHAHVMLQPPQLWWYSNYPASGDIAGVEAIY